MAVIRAKYADRLPIQTPPVWLGSYSFREEEADTPEGRARFARAYEMLVESVHLGLSAREIGVRRGISAGRARQLMVYAAYVWARRERIDLSGKLVAFKNEVKFVKNLYAGLIFFGQQKYNELIAQVEEKGTVPDKGQIL